MASAKGAEKTTTAQSLVSRPPPREEKPPLIMPRPPVWHNTANQPVNDVIVDSFLSNFLREHQREGVKFLYETVMGFKRTQVEECPFLGGAILADEMVRSTIRFIFNMRSVSYYRYFRA